MIDGPVAILAIDLHRVTRLSVNMAVAVAILREMTVGAVHPFVQMDVAEMHALVELIFVIGRDNVVVRIQHVALAIAFIDGAEYPSMAVEIGELGVF